MTLDLRDADRDDRRQSVFGALDDLDAGETVTLVTDQRPDALCHRYRIERGRHLRWRSTERDDGALAVGVTKGDAVGADELLEFDVRDMPPRHRHAVLTDAFDCLDPGEGFVLVNDHDPKPLYHRFDAEAGDEFRWTYRRRDPGEFRVLIGKAETGDGAAASPDETSDAPF